MNELIVRITVLTLCVIVLLAVVIIAVTGDDETTSAEVNLSDYYYVEATETTAVPETAATTAATTKAATVSEETTTAPVTEPPLTDSSGRRIITSRQRKDYDDNSVYIDMENILQLPELPVGCEITALTILLRHCGFDAEKTDMALNYLPISWGNAKYEDGKTYKDSFFNYFIGDPFGKGYGCFSGAIEKAANKYISEHGGGYTVKNISGAHPDVLYDYLAAGTPVLCWATDGMIEPEYYETWFDNETGEQLDWYLNEHCFVLAGFNMDADIVTLNDPMKGIIDYNINKFETRYDQMHRQAIVILPEDGTDAVESIYAETSVSETAETETSATETAGTSVPEEAESETVSESTAETELQTESSNEWLW
ncbi:MAG: C39 family peptidase [Oscillospiraceae bacterium]|nr:C39 family peptidase [Oscillospiraceae bacterium]